MYYVVFLKMVSLVFKYGKMYLVFKYLICVLVLKMNWKWIMSKINKEIYFKMVEILSFVSLFVCVVVLFLMLLIYVVLKF